MEILIQYDWYPYKGKAMWRQTGMYTLRRWKLTYHKPGKNQNQKQNGELEQSGPLALSEGACP